MMHIILPVTFGAIAIFVGVVWIIGLAIGHSAEKRRQEKIRVRMEAKRIRLEARVARRAQMKEKIQNFLPWHRH
jgi:hypothetical protein